MDEKAYAIYRDHSRKTYNEEFVRRLLARRPYLQDRYDERVKEITNKRALEMVAEAAAMPKVQAEALGIPSPTIVEMVNETIVFEERPVLFIKDDWIDTVNVTKKGVEAEELVAALEANRNAIEPIMPLIGRIDVVGFPGSGFVGTGWFVDVDIVVTNRHVASLIAQWDGRKYVFSRGVIGKLLSVSVSTLHEFDDFAADATREFAVAEVLYIEPDSGPNDIAFLKIKRRTDGSKRDRIDISRTDAADNVPVVTIGYPARAPKSVIPNQDLMKELYRDRYDVKRAAPGYTMAVRDDVSLHDCTTLGGNSGSAVLDLKTGEAIGLHFAGLYRELNYAVRASVLNEYISGKRWSRPPVVETGGRPGRASPAFHAPVPQKQKLAAQPASGAVTVTISLSITVSSDNRSQAPWRASPRPESRPTPAILRRP